MTAALIVDGNVFEGWTALRAERSIERISGAFNLEFTERWPGQPDRWAIEPGAECSLFLDGVPAITGAVDRSERSLSATSWRVAVGGRDKTADLVDCSACRPDGTVGELNNLTVLALARVLAKSFGISVSVSPGTDIGAPFGTWSVEPGETAFESLERAARQRALLLMGDGLGGLVITRGGTARHTVSLREGENILEASVVRDDSQRFRQYTVLGGTGADLGGTTDQASAIDRAVREQRRLTLIAEDLAGGVTLKNRVAWERDIRRARGRTVDIVVAGFSAGGELWTPNRRVDVYLPTLGVEAELLISSVVQTLDGSSGSRTALSLVPPDALSLLPEPETDSASWEGGL